MQFLPIIFIGIVIALAIFVIERRRSGAKSPLLLQAWGEQNINDSDVKQWLVNLSPQETKQLLRQLNRFCQQEKLDPDMLFQGKFGDNAALHLRATHIVSSYLTAAWQRAAIREDLAAHNFFSAYKKSPQHRKYHDFALDLYLRLIKANLVESPSLADSIMISERKQQKAAQAAILQVAKNDPPAFNTILKVALKANSSAN